MKIFRDDVYYARPSPPLSNPYPSQTSPKKRKKVVNEIFLPIPRSKYTTVARQIPLAIRFDLFLDPLKKCFFKECVNRYISRLFVQPSPARRPFVDPLSSCKSRFFPFPSDQSPTPTSDEGRGKNSSKSGRRLIAISSIMYN